MINILTLSGCESVSTPKEGELITWDLTPNFVIKTELGPRRDLVRFNKDTPLYKPELERYLGIFPLDYTPSQQIELSRQEMENFTYKNYNPNIDFDLALNGSMFKSNDISIYGDNVLLHKDQVKVSIISSSNDFLSKSIFSNIEIKNGAKHFEFSEKYNLDCYEFIHPIENSDSKSYKCFGKTKNSEIPEVEVNILTSDMKYIMVFSKSSKLGISVSWRIDESNLKDWENINTHVWNLINSWNVSPNTIDLHI